MNKLLEEQAQARRTRSTRTAAGSSSASSRSRPTRCGCRRGTPTCSKLSGGERRRVALCRLLLSKPDMLLLDEPTNHLDAESVAWLERYLEQYPGTVIAVTHDRYFLDNVAGWILELDRGHGIPWQGNYTSWLEQKEAAARGRGEAAGRRCQQDARARARVGAREPRRRARPRARRASRASRSCTSQEFQARNETERDLHSARPAARRARDRSARTRARPTATALLFENLTFSLPPGGIVGIIGPNGAGKTTLFRMHHRARRSPTAATIRIGPVGAARVRRPVARNRSTTRRPSGRRSRGGLDMIRVGNYETPSRGYVGRFNFRGTHQQQNIGELSGGERNRVHLAKVLKSRRQRAAARRADQRPRRRDAARARRGAAELPGLRGRDLARSLVPGPHRDPHPRVRRRQRGGLVRGQLRGVRARI